MNKKIIEVFSTRETSNMDISKLLIFPFETINDGTIEDFLLKYYNVEKDKLDFWYDDLRKTGSYSIIIKDYFLVCEFDILTYKLEE